MQLKLTGIENNNNHDDSLNHQLAGYGNAYSTFIPILDLMNPTLVRVNACSLEITDDGMYMQLFSGDSPMQWGDELKHVFFPMIFYCRSMDFVERTILPIGCRPRFPPLCVDKSTELS